MAYNDIISQSDAAPLVPEEAFQQIMGNMPGRSVIMSEMTYRLPNGTRNQQRIPVWSTLPTAGFRGISKLGQTTDFSWQNVYAVYENVDCYCPIPEEVLDDAAYPIWDEAAPYIAEAMGSVVDAAVIHGTDKPSSWTFDDILTGATSASHTLSLATHVGGGGDYYSALFGASGIWSMVENDGLEVNGVLSGLTEKAQMRGVRGANGHPVFLEDVTKPLAATLQGAPVEFSRNGGLNTAVARMVVGDWKKIAWSMRKDMTFKVIDQGVITDNTGTIVYNCAQQGIIVLKVTFRIGVARMNPPNRVNTNAATRHPFGVLLV